MNRAAWPLRVWGVRHIRAAYHTYRMERHYADWQKYFGALPLRMSEDLAVIEKIRRGEL